MNRFLFSFRGANLEALPSGAVFWPSERLLVVSDLHLGKSERMARHGGPMLPPYETLDTLTRLGRDIQETAPETVVCLGDSFDDLAAGRDLDARDANHLLALGAGRRWIWIEGNHDPGPLGYGGAHMQCIHQNGLTFRHIATDPADGEVSGHYHPKAHIAVRGRVLSRRCILFDGDRMILPAYGTYTGGLRCDHPDLCGLMGPDARAILVGQTLVCVPMPRSAGRRASMPAS